MPFPSFITNGKFISVLFLSTFFILSCSILESDDEQITNCILEEIRFNEVNSLKFQTISGGRIYQIKQLLTLEDEIRTVASFQFNYFQDSIAVVDQINPSTQPFLSINLENEKPKQITRFFLTAGVKLIHEITYPENDIIRVDLNREASTGDVLYVGYSLYYLNPNGNIVRNERFRADEDESSGFLKIEDRRYTYDDYPSPQDNLYLPFFADTNFPDVKFFSPNNILSFTEDNQTFEFQYQYDENNNTTSQILPMGQAIEFNYINCPD